MGRAIARRATLLAIGAIAFATTLPSFAQSPQKLRRIGYLSLDTGDSDAATMQRRLLRDSLRRLGYEDGINLAIEWRFADGHADRLAILAADLLRQNVELIVALLTESSLAAQRATSAIPIVMLGGIAPEEVGLVQSLSRPGANVTGTAWSSSDIEGKMLEILKEGAPNVRRVAVLFDPTPSGAKFFKTVRERAATALGLTLQHLEVTRADEIAPALRSIAASPPDALEVGGTSVLNAAAAEVASFAIEHKLLSIGNAPVSVRNGGLFYYGPDFPHMVERTASYVQRILAGAKPADLPIEQPTKYEFVINLKTAKAIGRRIPQSLLGRADRVID
jgi:putative tryptophan/tyrosine transport system substrate-binding protein